MRSMKDGIHADPGGKYGTHARLAPGNFYRCCRSCLQSGRAFAHIVARPHFSQPARTSRDVTKHPFERDLWHASCNDLISFDQHGTRATTPVPASDGSPPSGRISPGQRFVRCTEVFPTFRPSSFDSPAWVSSARFLTPPSCLYPLNDLIPGHPLPRGWLSFCA